MSNVHVNDYNDLAYLPHYARFPFTNSEHQDVIWGNQLPPKPTEATPARPPTHEAACSVGWSNLPPTSLPPYVSIKKDPALTGSSWPDTQAAERLTLCHHFTLTAR